MSELLYNKSKAVEELNKVEGFYPLELARVISNEGQEEQRYLDVKYRKLWFRLVNPTGKIISRIVHFTENMAVVEARIYLDKCDQEDNYIANSFSQKFRTADTQFGDKFLEMAETAAIGRALADAGYGLQFADVGEGNDPMQVDQNLSPEAVPGETPEEVAEQGFLQVDFNKLEEINPDVIAWIEIPGLEISYPVVQGRDNDYYLHHLITGENHKSGSIFMDFHNQEDLSDRNSIIYGHNMKDGSMFGTLDQYQSQALYRNYPYFYMYVTGYIYEYQIFSCYAAPTDHPA